MKSAVLPAVPRLQTRGLSKLFGTLRANDGIDLSLHDGQIHAVLGENGAGKSTLMKLLYGYYQPSAGTILVEGREVRVDSPRQGRALGIGMVFQNFTLIPAFRVWENVALFLDKPDRGTLIETIRALSQQYGLDVDPLARVADLPMGDRQKVEIVKILAAGAKLLIFDEPTSVLAPHEAENLFRVFDRLRDEGYAVVFISHKMAEVLRCADWITVLRRGRVAASQPREGLDQHHLVQLLVGDEPPREALDTRSRTPLPAAGPLLEFIHVGCRTDDGRPGLAELSFQVFPGEIVGVAAVSGNGQEFLADLVLGLRPLSEGDIFLKGRALDRQTPRDILAQGVSVLPEDPLRQGAIGSLSVRENLLLGRQQAYWTDGGWTPERAKMTADATQALGGAFVQAPPRQTARAADLSGGNLHRVLIAREMSRHPELFLCYYLTRGLDLSNAQAARDLVLRHAAQGMGVLFVSEDLDELFALSDRLLVLHGGRSMAFVSPSETTPQQVGLWMTAAPEGSHAALA